MTFVEKTRHFQFNCKIEVLFRKKEFFCVESAMNLKNCCILISKGGIGMAKAKNQLENKPRKFAIRESQCERILFFNKSKLSYFQIHGFAHLWSEGHQLRQIKTQLEIGQNHTLVDWSSFCREVIFIFYF